MASGANGLPQQQHGSDGKSRKTSNKTARGKGPSGLPIERRFTAPGVDPLDQVTYERRSSAITNPDGSIVFQMDGAEIPTGWSQLATDIVISKYFRKAGLHNDKDQGEKSVRQVVHRLAHTLRTEGEKFEGYFATKADADAFEAELSYLLVNQYGAFNSPVWFNLGLYHDYGITGQGGNWAWTFGPEVVEQTGTAYERPQCSACFIQSVPDDLMGIYDLMKSEARLFKYGSGTGSNFSAIRGKQEKLSGGGFSSGLLSFLEVFDRAAGSTKSGGTCLAPFQRVYTATGPVAAAELAQRESFVALSYDPPAGRYKAKKARAWLAGEKNVVRVVTDKGAFEITDDHPMKLSTGEFVVAGKLAEGMSLFACSIDLQHEHVRVHLRDGRKGKEFLHRLVASDVMELDVEDVSIHHKDEDKRNNEPWNLEAKSQAEHARDHNLDHVAEGTHLFQMRTFPKPGDSNGMHADSPFWKDVQKVEAYRLKQAEILAESGRAPIMQQYAAEQKMLNTAFEILNAGHSIDTFESYVQGRKALVGRIGSITKLRQQIIDRFGSYEAFVKAVADNNHRVVRVEPVGVMPVYDVEVQCSTADDKSPRTGHNFVIWPSDDHIGSGVVVANTRRAAKMVCLDMDHPEIVDFITWKMREEKKAHALIAAGYPSDFNGEAYHTISGQNSNNSVRVSDQFMTAVQSGASWSTRARTTGEIVETFEAKNLWRQLAEAAWACADPGVQYDTTINRWHTCPNTQRINASNPCQPAWATMLKKDGIRTLGEVHEGDVIWSGGRWTKVVKKWSTGIKPVFKYRTTAGSFVGTETHRVVSHGDKVEVRQAETIDACQGPRQEHYVDISDVFLRLRSHVLDGFAMGTGRYVPQQGIVVQVGAIDRDCFEKAFGAPGRPGRATFVGNASSFHADDIMCVGAAMYRVESRLTEQDLPPGPARRTIPEQYWRGSVDEVRGFLRGLYSANGWVIANRVVLRGSQHTVSRVQEMLSFLGIESNCTTRISRHDDECATMEYELSISSDRKRFRDLIGFLQASKQMRLDEACAASTNETHAKRSHEIIEVTRIGEEEVFDLTVEDDEHTYWTGGLLVSNCSEYMFLDDTACNLASVNLTKFLKVDAGIPGQGFDVEGYRHACRMFFIAQEILVDVSSYPTEPIAKNSHDYRPLGLGYANLGSLLMSWGVPYDSDNGRAIAGALTAIMCGTAYKTSAEMAATKGPFAGFAKNREPMLKVMRMHLDETRAIQAGTGRLQDDVIGLALAAREDWKEAVRLGTEHGYRNAQATVLAPTGTIGLLMDCDTTGVEPDFALVKFKKLAGGGHFKIVNQTVPAALRRLRYSEQDVKDIVAYISGTNSLAEPSDPRMPAPGRITRQTLKDKGLTDAEIGKAEAALPGVFDLDSAFASWVLGAETYARLGAPKDSKKLLEHIGFTRAQIDEAAATIIGRMTIEGAPHLRPEDYEVFDCANRCGKTGKRFLAPMSHVRMMAAVQPFLSGAISKCLVGETLVPTDKGLVRLGSFYDGHQAEGSFSDVKLRVPSRHGVEEATQFYFNGVQPTVKLTLADGRTEQGTPPHALLVATGMGLDWKRLVDIEPGDWVASKLGSEMWGEDHAIAFAPSPSYGSQHKDVIFPRHMTPRLGLFLGMLAADGHVTRENYTVGVTKGDDAVLQTFAQLTDELFHLQATPADDPRSNAKGMSIHSKAVVEFLDAIGFTKDQIPDCILTASRATVLSYMSGVYLDGWIAQSLSISQRRVGLTRDLQQVWANLGIHTYFNDNVIEGQNYPVLNVSGGYRRRAVDLLAFIEPHKRERAAALTNGENRELFPFAAIREQLCQRLRETHQTQQFRNVMDPRSQYVRMQTMSDPKLRSLLDMDPEAFTYVYTQVVSVEDGGLRPVFDLSVPGSHSYVANGVVSHNTVNLPSEATVEEVAAIYEEGWKLGLKAVALYRDGCKASQPLSTGGEKKEEKTSEMLAPMPATAQPTEPQLSLKIAPPGTRNYGERARLPTRRRGFTQEARIGNHKLYIRTGEYEDGSLGEIFIDMHKEGAAFRSVMNCLAMAVSLGLQYGVPLSKLVEQFTFTRFEPSGPVQGHPYVKFATSLVDYIFRTLGIEYLHRHDLAHIKPEIEAEGPTGLGVPRKEPSREPDSLSLQLPAAQAAEARARPESAMDAQLDGMMGDAPVCDHCGHITVRNGACYRCLNCGNSMGCS